ncbi:MAG: nickel pincer cofactor biosynthesis protein LarC [Desulfobacterales bacterium]|nr:MAG: nickel pincer cofactor biosynthesis protein LarC [Desulfobacterales bacterium]
MLAYFDCFAGISGDMTLGALVDLGVPLDWLRDRLKSIPLTDFDLALTSVHRNGIHAALVKVEASDDEISRNFLQIRSMIENSPLTDPVKSVSLQVFQRLAQAEASIHSCSIEQVHFHEVGGIDAIVDVVGTALGLEYLGIKKIIASPLPLGKGFVTCRHGKLPVPAPATLRILKGVPVYGTDIPYELVTPTGAAIIAGVAQRFGAMPDMILHAIGYGAGQRDLAARPNLLRVITGNEPHTVTETSEALQEDQVEIIETNIDDMNPELFGHLMDRLFEDGALDVYWIPIYMKKNRPGTMLQVLCKIDRRDALIHRILTETTTLGVRYDVLRRRLLERESMEVRTSYGAIAVKRIKDPKGNFRIIPEYEACRKIAREHDVPLRSVYETVTREIMDNFTTKIGE